MISIDNAVELTIKVYLGLPKRVTGLVVTRKEFREFSESFPLLLDALEKYASDKVNGVDLGVIDWYHRLRNELYHQGNGLTVEREKVETYAELANLLFENLFGVRLIEPSEDRTKLLGDFMAAWIEFERALQPLANSAVTALSRWTLSDACARRVASRQNKSRKWMRCGNSATESSMRRQTTILSFPLKSSAGCVRFLEPFEKRCRRKRSSNSRLPG
jgi:hypothetical protein